MRIILGIVGGILLIFSVIWILTAALYNWLKEKTMRGYIHNRCEFCKKPVGDSLAAVFQANRWFCCHRHYRFWLEQHDTKERRRESDQY